MATSINALRTESQAARIALDQLRAEHAGIQAKLGHAARAGGGGWTPRLRRRQAELSEQLLAAEVLVTQCNIAQSEAELAKIRDTLSADLRPCAGRTVANGGTVARGEHVRGQLLAAVARLRGFERERIDHAVRVRALRRRGRAAPRSGSPGSSAS